VRVQVVYVFGKADRKASTPCNAENGFRNSGICPFEPNIFDEEEFAVADTTGRPQIKNCDRICNSGLITDSHGSLEDIFHPSLCFHELYPSENKRASSD
jgi:hypothetical protein